ncbi:protein kinase [Streptomyces sp. NPDC032940]|uniref:serine/threonine-protein kinase n=1 Tax=Streptomyces sp. NPDC032940 TaxID=3155366 RepID=UPI0034090249
MNGEAGFGLAGSGAVPLEDGDPRRIGPIPLLGRLGAGGMGRVYLGVHERRFAAVKQLLPSIVAEDEGFLRRFGHELDNLARLPEKATAPLLTGDRAARPPWFATAYVPGLTLAEALDVHGGPLPAEALWLLLREAAAGLAAVHALDMVHRDLKPSNVMLTLDGLTLIDFGVARAAEQSRLTRTGMVVGTPAYMSPEQASGSRGSTGAVDVFALGSVLAYAATGRPPFGDESGHAVLYRVVHEEPDLDAVREIDADLADVVAACLDKDYEGRPTAAELVERAEAHGPFRPPLWPEAVTEQLAERAAFAARVPDEKDLPATAAEPEPEPGPASSGAVPVVTTDGRPPSGRPAPERRRRTRFVLAAVPVVLVVGTTLTVQLLPHTSDSGAHADGTRSPAASGPAAPTTAGPDATPGRSSSPSPSPSSGKEKARKDDGKREGEKDGTAARGDDGSASGTGPGGTGAAGDSGGGPGGPAQAGGSGGSAASGGSGSSGDGSSGGSSGSGGGTPSTGSFMLKNAANGKCLTANYYYSPYDGACSGDAASWSFQSMPGGTVRIVSGFSGQCLYASQLKSPVLAYTCGGTSGQEWRQGSGGTIRNAATGGCLAMGSFSGSGVTNETCDGSAAQRWSRI